ncbi:MAG: lipoate--protein ligase family protein [Bacteroidales bacterium]|nr:lipoate--protein ligase family protein [Candidatus Cryptobacteroides aphodequi]
MKFVRNSSTDPHYNMAFDEWCLEHCSSDEPFFYLWRNAPSVIVGLNQNVRTEVNLPFLEREGIVLARRVTGGGAVYHDLQNLNYSIVAPTGSVDAVQMVVDALRSLGVDAQRTGRNDIFVDGRKVSGYARRVWKDRELIHGTLMYDVDIDTLTRVLDTPESKLHLKGIASVHSRVANLKDLLPQFASLDQLQAALHDIFAAGDEEMPLPADAVQQINAINEAKFARRDWNYERLQEE